MNYCIRNIITLAKSNTNFRQELCTTERTQLVLMSLKPHEEIGEEVHTADQIITIVQGKAEAILNGKPYEIMEGSIVVVPEGTRHTIINRGTADLKLYTIYSPPQHKPGTIHKTTQDAQGEEAY